MDQVTKVRRHIKREEWKSIISECRASGMTVKAWCKANGIVEQTYYRNLKMLREEMLESLPAPIINDDCTEKPTVFKKLEVTTPVENKKNRRKTVRTFYGRRTPPDTRNKVCRPA